MTNIKRRIQILGATGSIGGSTIRLLQEHKERFIVGNLLAHNNYQKLAELAIATAAESVVIINEEHYLPLKDLLIATKTQVHAGQKAALELAAAPYDVTISAISGLAGFLPTLAAISGSRIIGLANKESIVCGAEVIHKYVKKHGCTLIPLDSEHNAIFQLLGGLQAASIHKATITASGGPFLRTPLQDFPKITKFQALAHPNWAMGAKNSVDSATLMNKGLELIELCKLFNLNVAQTEIIVHPESIMHGMISFADGTSLAHLAKHDMRVAISHVLNYPQRLPFQQVPLDLTILQKLHFEKPNTEKFPMLNLAYAALAAGNHALIMLNVADELAVDAFLRDRIHFIKIAQVVEKALNDCPKVMTNDEFEIIDFSNRCAAIIKRLIKNNF